MRFSITSKVTLAFVLFAAALLVGVSGLAYQNGRTALEDAVVSDLLSTALGKQMALDDWVTEQQSHLAIITTMPHLREAVAALAAAASGSAAARAAHDQVLAELRYWTGAGTQFEELLVIEPNAGQVIASTDAGEEGKFKENQPFFINGKAGSFVQNVYYSLKVQGPVMTLSTPLRAQGGQLLGVLAGHVNLDGMNAIVNLRTGLHRSDDAFLVNTSNLFVTQPRLVSDPAILQRGVHTEAINRCLAHNSGVVLADDYRGVPALVVYRWLPERELCLIVKMDQAEALAPTHTFGQAIWIVGGLVLLLASILSFGIARMITRPIRRLQAGAVRFGQGDLDYRIKPQARDEIGQLAIAMNEMATNLRASLGETARGQRLLVALSQAAQAVQRAQTPEQVYRAVGDRVTELGYHAIVFTVTPERSEMDLSYYTFDSALLQAAEKLASLSAEGLRLPLAPGSLYDEVINGGKTLFFAPVAERMTHFLPRLARALANQVAILLGIEQAIYAPLATADKPYGMLIITGKGLTEADVPAVTTIANQAAIALENTRLYQETRAWAAELEKRVEERAAALRESEERYRRIVETAQEGVWTIDAESNTTLVNVRMAEMLGYTVDEMIGAPLFQFMDEEGKAIASRNVERRRQGIAEQHDFKFKRKDGADVWALLSTNPTYDDEGRYTGGLAMVADITERRRMEEALRESEVRFSTVFHTCYDLRFGRPPFVSHQKWHGWNCQVDIIPHGCCPVAETKINAFTRVPLA